MDTLVVSLTGGGNADERWTGVVLTVDGRGLIDIVTEFEGRSGFDVVGGYDWLAVEQGPEALLTDLLGRGAKAWAEGRVDLLTCPCRDDGCWPVRARVDRRPDTVRWVDFQNPHRRERDYSALTFEFDAAAYQRAVDDVLASARARVCDESMHYCALEPFRDGSCPCCVAGLVEPGSDPATWPAIRPDSGAACCRAT